MYIIYLFYLTEAHLKPSRDQLMTAVDAGDQRLINKAIKICAQSGVLQDEISQAKRCLKFLEINDGREDLFIIH